jgi:hypothetical protein
MDSSPTELPFLDILIKKQGTHIVTDIYHKPTDTKQYLHFNSSHERHIKINLPYSLARRICTIIKDNELRINRLEELMQSLLQRGYPDKLIRDGISKALELDIAELRTPKMKSNDNNVIAFVTTHNPNNAEIFPTIHNNLAMLKQDQRLCHMLDKTKLIKSKRQPKNLKHILTNARYNNSQTSTENCTVSKCKDKRCGTCPHLMEGSNFIFDNGENFKIKSNFNCHAKNVIYAIICPSCQLTYIGQTTNLRSRVTLHKQHNREAKYRTLHVNKHLSQCGKCDFKIFPFYQLYAKSGNISSQLENKEKMFIDKYKPSLNRQ